MLVDSGTMLVDFGTTSAIFLAMYLATSLAVAAAVDVSLARVKVQIFATT